MGDATPIYGIRYQLLADAPNGAALGENGFDDVEDQLARIDALILALSGISVMTTAWTDFVPGWSASSVNPTIGNGSIAGRYKSVGKTCWWYWVIGFGSTTNPGSGVYSFGLPPVGNAASSASGASMGFRDNSAAQHTTGFATWGAGGAVMDGRANGGNQVGNTVPYTWASTDFIRCWGAFEFV